MSSEPRTVTVHILGQPYRIRSSESADFMREVSLYVDELMHQIAAKMASGTQTQVAVLAALNIAEELFRERRDGATGDTVNADALQGRLAALLKRVDEIVDEPGATNRKPKKVSRARAG